MGLENKAGPYTSDKTYQAIPPVSGICLAGGYAALCEQNKPYRWPYRRLQNNHFTRRTVSWSAVSSDLFQSIQQTFASEATKPDNRHEAHPTLRARRIGWTGAIGSTIS